MDEFTKNLKHADKWTVEGNGFAIEVSRHDTYGGENGWCLYAVIRKGHPLFDLLNVEGKRDWEIDAINSMPLHGGCTYFEPIVHAKDGDGLYGRNYKRGEIHAFKVGCDYSHLHDEWFRQAKTKGDAGRVFADAECLFEHCKQVQL